MGIVIFDGVAYGMLLFLISVGLSVTLGLMRFVNLAHGVFAMVGAYAAAIVSQQGWGFLPALVAGSLAAALAGAVLEVLLYRRLYSAHPLDQVLFSIGLVFVAMAVFTYVFGPTLQAFTLPAYLEGRIRLFGTEVSRYRLFLVVCGAIVFSALLWLLRRSRYGARVRAAVDDPQVASASGIPVQRLFLLTFSLGCGLAGLGGALSLGMLGLEPSFPLKYMIFFLIVVCVGGAGTLTGPFLAALIVGVVDVAGKYYWPETGTFLIYAFMVAMLLLRPRGLISRPGF